MTLSKTTVLTLAALASDDRLVIGTLRNTADDWSAHVARSQGETRFTVPIATFRKMRRDGLVVKRAEWKVSGTLVHSEYVLTDTGRAALDAA